MGTGTAAIDLRGRRALVTGGGVGIGRAVCRALAGAGADVALTHLSHDGAAVRAEAEALGARSWSGPMDATDAGSVRRVMGEVEAALGGPIDILVNNAGGLVGRVQVADMSDEHWRRVIDVNLTSAFVCVREALAHMGSGWGRIVNVSSQAARNGGGPGAVAYAAAKAGLHGLTYGLAKELAGRGITVNAVAPGLVLDTALPRDLHHGRGPAGDGRGDTARARRDARGRRGAGPLPGVRGGGLRDRPGAGRQRRNVVRLSLMSPEDLVERWMRALEVRVGMPGAERAAHLAALRRFCESRGTDPASLLAGWESHPELTLRRRYRATGQPNLSVESFLIHNGINVFGDIVCVPKTPAQVREQGAEFVVAEAVSSG